MIFSATNSADHFPKNMDVHSSFKNPSTSSSGMNGAEEKPRLVFRIKLPPALNKGKKPCKVIKDRADDQKRVPTPSSGTNGVEKKSPLVFKIKLPTTAHNKDEKLVPTSAFSGISMGNGSMNSCLKNPFSSCPKKLAPAPCVVTKERSDKKPVPTSSTDMICAEKKPYHVTRVKLPTPNNKGIELNGNNGEYLKKLAAMASSGMSSSDGKKERRVVKIRMPTALRQNKKEQINIQKMAVQQSGFTNDNSAIPKDANKSCLKKLEIDEELLELKLEATSKNSKRKIQLLDFQDICQPENVMTKRLKIQYMC